MHVIQLEPQGLADEGERIPRIVEAILNEDQEARMMEECGDSSDDEDYPLPPVNGETRVLEIQ